MLEQKEINHLTNALNDCINSFNDIHCKIMAKYKFDENQNLNLLYTLMVTMLENLLANFKLAYKDHEYLDFKKSIKKDICNIIDEFE